MADAELDLDELHQAVNQMMNQRGKPKPQKPAQTSAPASVAPAPKPPISAPKPTPNAVPVTVNRPLPRLQISRPRGVAMDIVAATPPVAPPSSRPARVAPALEPSKKLKQELLAAPDEELLNATNPASTPATDPIPAPRAATAPAATAKADEVSDEVLASLNMQSESVKPAAEPVVAPEPHSAWPDPIDLHKEQIAAAASVAEPVAKAPLDEPEETPPLSQLQETQALLAERDQEPTISSEKSEETAPESTSPFVTTNVKKRPLGAFTPAVAVPTPGEEVESPTLPLPPPKMPEVASESTKEVTEIEEKPQDAPDLKALSQMAIPQQYKAAANEPSKAMRPVFDTKDYHAPLQPGAAKPASHRGVGWVIWLLVLVFLLVAAASAYVILTGNTDITKVF